MRAHFLLGAIVEAAMVIGRAPNPAKACGGRTDINCRHSKAAAPASAAIIAQL